MFGRIQLGGHLEAVSYKVKHTLSYNLAILLLGVYSRKIKTYSTKDL